MYPFRLGFISSQTHLGFLPKAMRMGRKRELAPGRRPKKRGRPFAMTPRFRRSKKVAKKGDGFDGFGTPAPPLCVEGNGGSPPTSGSWSVQIRSKDLVDAKNPNDDANMVSVVARKELVFNAASMPNLAAMQLRGSLQIKAVPYGFHPDCKCFLCGDCAPNPHCQCGLKPVCPMHSKQPNNQNDDDQVDAGEPNAPAAENPNQDACLRRTCADPNGCGNIFCYECYSL
jgi:hypothetical protein